MAELLIESMEGSWDPSRYHDTHRQKIEALIEEKRQGRTIVATAPLGRHQGRRPHGGTRQASIKAKRTATNRTHRKGTARTKPSVKRAPARSAPEEGGQGAGGQGAAPPSLMTSTPSIRPAVGPVMPRLEVALHLPRGCVILPTGSGGAALPIRASSNGSPGRPSWRHRLA